MKLSDFLPYTHSPPTLPGVRHTADDGAEHEGGDEGEQHQVDQPFQTIITQPRHSLDVILRGGKNKWIINRNTNTHHPMLSCLIWEIRRDIAMHPL